MKRALTLLFLLALIAEFAAAQQLYNFSMVRENFFMYNPAVTGTNVGVDITAGFRKQWMNIDNSPLTANLTAQGSFPKNVGLGGFLLHDESGPTTQTGMGVSFAYHIYLNKQFYNRKLKGRTGKVLSFGMNASFFQYRLRTQELRAYPGEEDPGLTAATPRIIYPDASFGVAFRSKKLYTGFSIPQLLNMTISYGRNGQTETRLKKISHFYSYFGYKFYNRSATLMIEPTVFMRVLADAPPQADLMLRFTIHDLVWLGLNYRTVNTAIFEGGVEIKDRIRIGYAYDFNFDNYRAIQGQNHEVLLALHLGQEEPDPIPGGMEGRDAMVDSKRNEVLKEKRDKRYSKEQAKDRKKLGTDSPDSGKAPKSSTPKKKKGEMGFDDY